MKLILDIETVPSQSQEVRERIEAGVKPPGNITKEDSLAKWNKEKAPEIAHEKWLKTALDGTYGEIICICWAVDEGEVHSVSRRMGESEREMLANFYNAVKEELKVARVSQGGPDIDITASPMMVGHNVGFDIRFLWQRSVLLQVTPSFHLPVNAAPWSGKYFDTMTTWAGVRDFVKLDAIARAFGLEGKGDMSGADVWPLVKEGRIDEVVKYCTGDVEDTRTVAKYMERYL